MNIKEITRIHLKKGLYHGLYSEKHDCWCADNKNLCNCRNNFKDCLPGVWDKERKKIVKCDTKDFSIRSIKQSFRNYLVSTYYDGFVSLDRDCWCDNTNLFHCDHNFKYCVPGYWDNKKNEIVIKKPLKEEVNVDRKKPGRPFKS